MNVPVSGPGARLRLFQDGQAAVILLLLIVLGVIALVYGLATPARESIAAEKRTAAALAQAKAALIGAAVGMRLDTGTPRVGDLPCPDLLNTGDAGTSCSNAGGTTIGRLPWQRLGLPDLRDGSGERLWYAVTDNFKNNPAIGTLNSDSRGGITLRDRSGTMMHDGTNPNPFNPSGVIAVIIAPGPALRRQGAGVPQDRGCTGDTDVKNCIDTGICSSVATPRCNPANYLDVVGPPVMSVAGATGLTEDNANFGDTTATNGFISGDIFDVDPITLNRNPIVNDRIITITYADLMPLMERRVAKEAFNCLTAYAAASNGRYPWAARIDNSALFGDYSSRQGVTFGRMPSSFAETMVGTENLLDAILVGVVNSLCTVLPTMLNCMSNSWPPPSASPPCYIGSGSWWLNWREHVFYGVAPAYQPDANVTLLPPGVTVPASSGCGSCLSVDTTTNRRFVVVVAGKRLSGVSGGQPRASTTNKSLPQNYLEDQNGDPTGPPYVSQSVYTQKATTATFNDVLLFQ